MTENESVGYFCSDSQYKREEALRIAQETGIPLLAVPGIGEERERELEVSINSLASNASSLDKVCAMGEGKIVIAGEMGLFPISQHPENFGFAVDAQRIIGNLANGYPAGKPKTPEHARFMLDLASRTGEVNDIISVGHMDGVVGSFAVIAHSRFPRLSPQEIKHLLDLSQTYTAAGAIPILEKGLDILTFKYPTEIFLYYPGASQLERKLVVPGRQRMDDDTVVRTVLGIGGVVAAEAMQRVLNPGRLR